MKNLLDFIINHYDELLAIIGAIVSLSTIIVKLTPTTKDDAILKTLIGYLESFSLVNTKENQKKLENTATNNK